MNIREIAKRSGVSVATVSRSINQPEKVSPETRARILETIDRLNYVPNPSAQSLSCFEDLSQCNPQVLASAMVGRQVSLGVNKSEQTPGEPVLVLDRLCVSDGRRRQIIKDFTPPGGWTSAPPPLSTSAF